MRTLTEAEVAEHLGHIADQGYTVVEDAIEPDLVDALVEALARLGRDLGIVPAANTFEGRHTTRIYNLLVHGDVFARVPVHGNVLPLVEGVLDPGCLLSSLSSIAIGPERPSPSTPTTRSSRCPSPTRPSCATACGLSPSSPRPTAPPGWSRARTGGTPPI